MRLVIPNSQRINRGGLVLGELVETCRNHGFSDIVVLHEHRGEPGAALFVLTNCGYSTQIESMHGLFD
jgi:U3 small nucleolar ribonucleoprotein protein IMP4